MRDLIAETIALAGNPSKKEDPEFWKAINRWRVAERQLSIIRRKDRKRLPLEPKGVVF
jgi:hypothetical protein